LRELLKEKLQQAKHGATAQNLLALMLREWIDACFDLKLKRTPVSPPGTVP